LKLKTVNRMRWRSLFIVSACVNAVLLASVWLYARKASVASTPPADSATSAEVRYRTNVVVRRQFFMWDQVESDDYATYIANLRDIGCPEPTIADIIIADVNQLYARRELETPAGFQFKWWEAQADDEFYKIFSQQRRALEAQRRAVLNQLLGPNWTDNSRALRIRNFISFDGPVLGAASPATRQAVRDIFDQQELAGRGEPVSDPVFAQATNAPLAQAAARKALAAILTPAQIEELLLRHSLTASGLRSVLAAGVEVKPDEFRALFRASDKLLSQSRSLAETDDANQSARMGSIEDQYRAILRKILGPERFARLERLQDEDYRAAMADAPTNATPGMLEALFQINKASSGEMDRILANTNLTDLQKQIAIKKVELAQLEAQAQATGQAAPTETETPPLPPDLVAAVVEAALPEEPQPRVHTIRSGDSVGRLSTQYGVPAIAILNANPGLQVNTLKVGAQIIIPPPPRPQGQ
jgi:LysM repeat protein/DNA-binding TFAR19-related protein (PDSD5 family)